MLSLPEHISREKAAQAKAQRLGDIIEQLDAYDSRGYKLVANFTHAENKAKAMSKWITSEWIPRQTDKELLRELANMVGILDFVGFVFHGVGYWDRVEKIRKMKILGT